MIKIYFKLFWFEKIFVEVIEFESCIKMDLSVKWIVFYSEV